MEFHFAKAPSTLISSLRSLLPKEAGVQKLEAMEQYTGSVTELVAEPRRLRLYRTITASPDDELLPICFPHTLVAPCFMHVLTARSFPFKTMGMIHVRNVIESLAPIPDSEDLDFYFSVGSYRQVKRGIEFDVRSEASYESKVLWREVCTFLFVTKRREKKSTAAPVEVPPRQPNAELTYIDWDLPESLGRSYARASGDFNPIHLHRSTAKIFGFHSPIIHGMWTQARIASELGKLTDMQGKVFSIDFRAPIFLPTKLKLGYRKMEDGFEFEVVSAKDFRAQAKGKLTAKKI